MTVRVVVGRTEGLVSSVGLMLDGNLPFVCRGENQAGLHWVPAVERQRVVRELRFLIEYLKSAGVVVEGAEKLDEVK